MKPADSGHLRDADGAARRRFVYALALPIVGGMVSQNVLNLVDTAMVGSLGDAALAAVGTSNFANFLAIAFITGLSAGVQAMVARRLGEGRLHETAVPLNGALLIAVLLAVPLSIGLHFLAEPALRVLNRDPAVVEAGVPYLQARLFAMTAVGINFSFRGFWNGVNMSRLYLRTLLVMHAINIFLNWVLIFGHLGAPALGATGAGIASAAATYVGSGYYIYLAFRHARGAGFLRGLPDLKTIRTMLRLAVPNGLQQMSFAGSLVALFWVLGRLGGSSPEVATASVAAANVVINVTLVAVLPGMALGITAASLVGQALGRKDSADARRWGWDVARVTMVGLALLGLPMVLVPDLILGGFLHDPDTLALARAPLRLVGIMIAFDGLALVFQNALLGAGASRTVAIVAVSLQWLFALPAAYIVGPLLGGGLFEVWASRAAYTVLSAASMVTLWRRGHWANIEV